MRALRQRPARADRARNVRSTRPRSTTSEHQFELPGIQLVETYLRNYPYGSLAAQVLGDVGPITALSSAQR